MVSSRDETPRRRVGRPSKGATAKSGRQRQAEHRERTKMERAKLAKLLEMLGSDSAGERANAVDAIVKWRRRKGRSWDDLIS